MYLGWYGGILCVNHLYKFNLREFEDKLRKVLL
jgi:hypothetical protein